jgi:hypothetical protein
MGLASKNGIHRMVHGLIERGAIKQGKGYSRSIEIVSVEADAPPKLPLVVIKIRGDGHYMGADQQGEVEVRLERV